jgi:hypothetical protein
MSTDIKTKIYRECIQIMDDCLANLTESLRGAGLSDHAKPPKKMPQALTDKRYQTIVGDAMEVFSILMDLYSVARFFKPTVGSRVIVYAGAVHILHYVQILQALGGKVEYEYFPASISAQLPFHQKMRQTQRRRWWWF